MSIVTLKRNRRFQHIPKRCAIKGRLTVYMLANSGIKGGKGQNEMVHTWLKQHADRYLARMLEPESLTGSQGHVCATCSSEGDLFQCHDCLHRWANGQKCLVSSHASMPTHRFCKWVGTHYEDICAKDVNLVFHLGHGGKPCSLGKEQNFVLGDVNGLHEIRIHVCLHKARGSTMRQLLEANIFPCSEDKPQSGFTFSVLRLFSLLATEAKLSPHRFYNVLVYRTNAVFPGRVPDQYGEFMRATRQWQLLQDLKRSGQLNAIPQQSCSGDLVLCCPACPHLGINYEAADVYETEE